MVSYQGTCEFYDNTLFYPSNVIPNQPQPITYPENSIMDYLHKHHPKFAYIAKTAQLNWYLASDGLRSTLFLPQEEGLNQKEILNLDQNTARRIIKYHLMTGLFPKDVLLTSPYQQLQSTLKGSWITAIYQYPYLYLNNNNPVLMNDIQCKNGIIHIIQNLLIIT